MDKIPELFYCAVLARKRHLKDVYAEAVKDDVTHWGLICDSIAPYEFTGFLKKYLR